MKKLLLLGDNTHSDCLIKFAKERGVYTIATDNKSVEDSPVKLMADEYWDISVLDIDALEKKAIEAGVTAVICGASEVCVEGVRELCKRLNLPFWVNDKAWEYTNDKKKFKDICKECGLPVVKEYQLTESFDKTDLDNIEYPVVVKPVDGCSSIGVHVCNNEDELRKGYMDALENSKKKQVIVEKFMTGYQLTFHLIFKKERAQVFISADDYGVKEDGNTMVFYSTPTKYEKMVRDNWGEAFQRLFKELGCDKGVGFVQMMMDHGTAAVLEMNYRLPGIRGEGESVFQNHLLDFVLGEENTSNNESDFIPKVQLFGYILWLKPGVIGRIDGAEELRKKIKVVTMVIPKKVGDEIVPDSGMKRVFTNILFAAEIEEVAKCIDIINDTLIVEDQDGNDMLYRYKYE
ncbi:MAG: ATP-grasp domain-containing protein [Lachnospiraceae bacterium]|nr:ATP-grasp domain-containing protein [Lachnospiraceae bacterium]